MQHWNKAVVDVSVYKRINLLRKKFEKDTRRIECQFEFSSILGYHKTGSSLATFKVVGINEGKESFINQLIRLMCGTHDDPDDSL